MVASVLIAQGIAGAISAQQGAAQTAAGAEASAASVLFGGALAQAGSIFDAQGFRAQAKTVGQAYNFNSKLLSINTLRQIDVLSSQFQRTVGSQLVQQAVSGISISSRSFLQVQNETSSIFEQAFSQLKVDSENQRRQLRFEADSKMVRLENQARAADFRAEAEKVLSIAKADQIINLGAAQSSQQMSGIGKMLPTLLSGAGATGGAG